MHGYILNIRPGNFTVGYGILSRDHSAHYEVEVPVLGNGRMFRYKPTVSIVGHVRFAIDTQPNSNICYILCSQYLKTTNGL